MTRAMVYPRGLKTRSALEKITKSMCVNITRVGGHCYAEPPIKDWY
jgi:hypothetical protein